MTVPTHTPVLLQEVMTALEPVKGQQFLDGTFGRGGHTRVLLATGAKVLALDCDAEAISAGSQEFAQEILSGSLVLERANFGELNVQPQVKQLAPFIGMLFDFGVSSPQLDTASRGFSFQQDAPLDMRMDDRLGVTAADLLKALGKREIADMLKTYVQEKQADRIASAIVYFREQAPIETTRQLASIVEKQFGHGAGRGHLHPATKTFLALRMVVNGELQSIQAMLSNVLELLAPNGKIATVSFQEMEDRLVKRAFRSWEEQGKGVQIYKHPVEASEDEVHLNPRSRSAKLRVFRKGAV